MIRRLTSELAVHLFIAATVVVAPLFDALRTAVDFDTPARIAIAAALLGSAWVRRPSLQPPTSLLRLAFIVTAAAQVALLVGTGKPGSVLWSLYLVSLWEGARHPRGGALTLALACAVPWLSLGLFAREFEGVFLSVPLTFALFGPPLHLTLRSRARRVRALEEKTTELRMAMRRRQADLDRARLLENVELRLRGSLARIQAQADTLERALQAGASVTGEELTALSRAALHELRDAVWALDPSDGRWASVEAHLRRVAADFGALALDGDFQPDEVISAADRLALLRRLRGIGDQALGRSLRVTRKPDGLTLGFVDNPDRLEEPA